MLTNIGVTVRVVERDEERCAELANALPSIVAINGDVMQKEVLLEEGLEGAGAFIALTGTDEKNILSAFAASGHNVPTVISKVNSPELALTAEKLGLECMVSPKKLVIDVVTRYVRALQNSVGSRVETLYKLMDGKAVVLEFKVREDFEFCNISLSELNIKNNILVAGIVRKRKPIIPTGSDVILPGDKVIVLAAGKQLGDLSDIIG